MDGIHPEIRRLRCCPWGQLHLPGKYEGKVPDETYKRLRYKPESWTVELHTVEDYVGIGGNHQDEYLRGKRPKDLLRNSLQ